MSEDELLDRRNQRQYQQGRNQQQGQQQQRNQQQQQRMEQQGQQQGQNQQQYYQQQGKVLKSLKNLSKGNPNEYLITETES